MSSPVNNPLQLQPEPYQRRRRRSGLITLVVVLVWLAGLGYAALHRQDILDWWKLHGYEAPATVATLADQDTMTDYGRKIFYVNRPEIEAKAAFAKSCPNNGGEQTIVLGCYHGDQQGIFLLSVDDPRLDGVLQVTAAHEMLHAAYDRLSKEERNRVDTMLEAYYEQIDDPRLLKTIDSYKKSEPDDVVNEMHSIFGTEVAKLPADLEEYYRQYFTDRPQIAAFAADYQAEFTDRENLVAQYDAQLADLKVRIESMQAELKSKQAEISEQQDQLLRQKNSGDTAGYNAGVPIYNGLVNQYNTEVESVKQLITQYNALVEKRNAVALEEDQLVESLNSNASPIR